MVVAVAVEAVVEVALATATEEAVTADAAGRESVAAPSREGKEAEEEEEEAEEVAMVMVTEAEA